MHRLPRSKFLRLIMAAVCAFSVPALAHHSGAMFDRERTITISGVVKEFLWNNPHSSIKVEVTQPGGEPVLWAIEMNAPGNLQREGWKRTTLHSGDKVTLTVNPLRSGQPGGWYLGIRLADGTTLGQMAPTEPAHATPAQGR